MVWQDSSAIKDNQHRASRKKLTWRVSDCAGPRRRCCRRCSRRSRPWRLGWWPVRSRPGPMRSARPWCAGFERLNPRWSRCLLHPPRWVYARLAGACRNGCSCPGSEWMYDERLSWETIIFRWLIYWTRCLLRPTHYQHTHTQYLFFTRDSSVHKFKANKLMDTFIPLIHLRMFLQCVRKEGSLHAYKLQTNSLPCGGVSATRSAPLFVCGHVVLTKQSSWDTGLLLPGWLMSQILTQPLPPV